jgi:hypothetical protein
MNEIQCISHDLNTQGASLRHGPPRISNGSQAARSSASSAKATFTASLTISEIDRSAAAALRRSADATAASTRRRGRSRAIV